MAISRVCLLLLVALLAGGPAIAAVAAEAPHGEGGPPAAPLGPTFVKMPPIVVPVIVGDRVTEQVGVELVLELAQGKTAEEISPKRPLLRDAFIRDIYGLYEMRATNGQRVDEDLLKAVLARRAAGILGPGVVHQVLIQRLFEQRR